MLEDGRRREVGFSFLCNVLVTASLIAPSALGSCSKLCRQHTQHRGGWGFRRSSMARCTHELSPHKHVDCRQRSRLELEEDQTPSGSPTRIPEEGRLCRELFWSSSGDLQSTPRHFSPQNQTSKQTARKNNNKLPAFGTLQCRTRANTASDLTNSNR